MASVRGGIVLGSVAFFVTLAVIIGVRLDQAALTVVVGVACGVGASIPTGLLVVLLMRRRELNRESRLSRRLEREMETSGRVVVVAPTPLNQLSQPTVWPAGYERPVSARREFTVIGEEGFEDGFDFWQE